MRQDGDVFHPFQPPRCCQCMLSITAPFSKWLQRATMASQAIKKNNREQPWEKGCHISSSSGEEHWARQQQTLSTSLTLFLVLSCPCLQAGFYGLILESFAPFSHCNVRGLQSRDLHHWFEQLLSTVWLLPRVPRTAPPNTSPHCHWINSASSSAPLVMHEPKNLCSPSDWLAELINWECWKAGKHPKSSQILLPECEEEFKAARVLLAVNKLCSYEGAEGMGWWHLAFVHVFWLQGNGEKKKVNRFI